MRKRYLGMGPLDLRNRPYAEFWDPEIVPLAEHAKQAIARGSLRPEALPALASAAGFLDEPAQEVENGFAVQPDGSMHIAIQTEMPGVSPEMVDWWFGWHSAEPERYKLWHPKAHVHARWSGEDPPGLRGRARYVGRTSIVDEFIGTKEGRYTIRFVRPSELGFRDAAVGDPKLGTAVCARVGFAAVPIDIGYLAHHVRAIPGGSEMRSRFWIGGRYAGGRDSRAGAMAVGVGRLFLKPPSIDLLVHCSEEMTHLAQFLPALHARCRDLH